MVQAQCWIHVGNVGQAVNQPSFHRTLSQTPFPQDGIRAIPEADLPEAAASLGLPGTASKDQVVAALLRRPVVLDLEATVDAVGTSLAKCKGVVAALSTAGAPSSNPEGGVSAFDDNGFVQQADELLAKLLAKQIPRELMGSFLSFYQSQLPAFQQYLQSYTDQLTAMQVGLRDGTSGVDARVGTAVLTPALGCTLATLAGCTLAATRDPYLAALAVALLTDCCPGWLLPCRLTDRCAT